MDFAWSEEQEALRETARAFLAEHAGPGAVRRAMATEAGHDLELWKRITQELGWTAIPVPEAQGGLGLGLVELVALLEVMGEFLPCVPFFSTACLGAAALLEAGSAAQQAAWLPRLAAGDACATLAVAEANGDWSADGIAARARPDGAGYVLDGTKRFVPDGHTAELVVVATRAEGTSGAEGVSLFLVPGDAPGLTRHALPTLDATRRLAELRLDGVRLEADARLAAEGAGWPACARVLERAAIALGAEQLGGAQRCLDLAVEHATQRVQFGRPIGSFQAVKHRCADLLLAVESARSAVYYAACAAGNAAEELAQLAPLVKSWCSEAYFACAAESLQLHGGVGFTFEYDVHLHLKRARSMEAFLGAPSLHRERIARAIGLGDPE